MPRDRARRKRSYGQDADICVASSVTRTNGARRTSNRSLISRMVTMVLSLILVVGACSPSGQPEIVASAGQAAVPIAGSSQIVVELHNAGDGDDRLVGAHTDRALAVEIHLTEIVDGTATMRQLEEVELPAGSTTRFRPGGLHLMMVVPDPDIVLGAQFDLILDFERSDSLTVEVDVVDLLDLAESTFDTSP